MDRPDPASQQADLVTNKSGRFTLSLSLSQLTDRPDPASQQAGLVTNKSGRFTLSLLEIIEIDISTSNDGYIKIAISIRH